jgi:hypothetical protein
MSKMLNRYYNTTDSPVVVDSEGHSLDGRGHVDCEPTPELVHGVEVGFLIDQGPVEENAGSGDPAKPPHPDTPEHPEHPAKEKATNKKQEK